MIMTNDDDDVYYYNCWRLKLEGETESICVCTKERKGVSCVMCLTDDVYYYNCRRLKLEGETESICVCTKERKGVSAEVLVATPCTNSLGGESGEQKHEHLQKYAFTWLRQK